MADGKVTIDTSLDNSGFIKDANSLEKAAKKAGSAVESAFGQSTSKAAEAAKQKLRETQIEIENVRQKMFEIENAASTSGEATSDAYEKAKIKLEAIGAELDQNAAKLDAMRVNGGPFGPNMQKEYDRLLAQNDRLLAKYNEQSAVANLAKQNAVNSAGVQSAEYKKLESQLNALNVEAAQYQSRINNASTSMAAASGAANSMTGAAKRAKKAVQSIGDGKTMSSLDGIGAKIDKVASRIKAMFLTAVLYRGLQAAFRAVAEHIKTLVANNAQLSASLNSIKVSLSSAFASIWTACLPALNALLSAIARVVAAISSLISGLFGQTAKQANANAKALNNQAGATGAAGGAAAKAEKQVASFDEINKLTDNTSGGGGGGGGLDYDNAEIVETAEWLEKLKALWEDIKSAFMDGFALGWGKQTLEPLKEAFKGIGESLAEILGDTDVQSAAYNFLMSFARAVGSLVGSVASIGVTIATAIFGGIDKYLEQNKGEIKQWLIDTFDVGTKINDAMATLFANVADVFMVFGGESGQQIVANIINSVLSVAGDIILLGEKLGRDILNGINSVFDENGEGFTSYFAGLLEIVESVTGTISTFFDNLGVSIQTVYDTYISPTIGRLFEGINTIVAKILEMWETYVKPFFDNVALGVEELVNGPVGAAVDQILGFIGRVIEIIGYLWNSVIAPVLAKVVDIVVPKIVGAMNAIWNIVKVVFNGIAGIIDAVFTVLNGLIDFVVGVFTGDWERAWDGIKGIFSGVWNAIASICETVVNGIVAALNSISFDVPDWVPLIGGQHFGFNLTPISIPRLAQGAVLPANKPFLSVVGDQTNGTNVEAPLDTIKQALIEALLESGALSRGSDGDIIFEIDGTEFARIIKPFTDRENNRVGVKLIEGGV